MYGIDLLHRQMGEIEADSVLNCYYMHDLNMLYDLGGKQPNETAKTNLPRRFKGINKFICLGSALPLYKSMWVNGLVWITQKSTQPAYF